ncbi:MAG: hypothetical protein ACKOSQ_08685 [Planctomycetaceae bacterium]
MADDFERWFRMQSADIFQPGAMPRAWTDFGLAYLRFSDEKYQSFFCFNALHGIHGCTNRGYKPARIIADAVLGAVMASLFTDDFITDLTADVNARLAWIARQPIPSTKKLEQKIAKEDRQLKIWGGRSRPNGPKREQRETRSSHSRMTARRPPARRREIAMEPHEGRG